MDELQSLITDLDRLLWEFPLTEQPEVLAMMERIQRYLLTRYASSKPESAFSEQTAEIITQAILSQLERQISPWLQPLHKELDKMRQQQQFFLQEIRQLEEHRQHLMAQALSDLQTDYQPSLSSRALEGETTWRNPLETLEQNLQEYVQLLSEGLKRMHELGEQGEARFLAYFNRIQQHLADFPLSFPEKKTTETTDTPPSKAIALTLAHHNPTLPPTTLVIEVGEEAVALFWVDMPEILTDLTNISTQEQYFACGTAAITQDTLTQLIYPQWIAQVTSTLPPLLEPFPQVGHPDRQRREAFIQQLQHHPLGSAFLEAAKLSLLILQHQAALTSTLAGHAWAIDRQDLLTKVVNPWLKQLEKEIDGLVNRTQKAGDSLGQIIVCGEGMMTLGSLLTAWLQDKFPQASVILADEESQEV